MTKITAVMTTIYVPHALKRFVELGPDVEFIVVGDRKTPPEAAEFCKSLGARFIGAAEQERLGYECSELIGWNCIQRRTIGILEALKSKPDILYQFDDDNEPIENTFFDDLLNIFSDEASYIAAGKKCANFNLGDCARDRFYYRGFPYSSRGERIPRLSRFRWGNVGVFNSLIFGDPDINASERLEKNVSVTRYEYPYYFGVISPTLSPLDTQSTAYRKELAPLAFVLPGVGRYDDIWAGYIAQYYMRQTDYALVYGLPAVMQKRHEHNLFKDLRDELMGMEFTERFIDDLTKIAIDGADIPTALTCIAQGLDYPGRPYPFPVEFLKAYARDLEGVL